MEEDEFFLETIGIIAQQLIRLVRSIKELWATQMEQDIPACLYNRLGETVGTNKLLSECLDEVLMLKVAIQETKWICTKTMWVWYPGKWRIECVYVKIYHPAQWDAKTAMYGMHQQEMEMKIVDCWQWILAHKVTRLTHLCTILYRGLYA